MTELEFLDLNDECLILKGREFCSVPLESWEDPYGAFSWFCQVWGGVLLLGFSFPPIFYGKKSNFFKKSLFFTPLHVLGSA